MDTKQPKGDATTGEQRPGYNIISLTLSTLAVLSVAIYLASGLGLSNTPEAPPVTTIVSYDPLIIYLEKFLSLGEVAYLKNLAQERYNPSKVTDETNDEKSGTSSTRRSSTAILPRQDAVVRSVITRAAKFQGFAPTNHFENIQATSYVAGQEYKPHYDVLSTRAQENRSENSTERVSTMFVILEDNCETNCGTQFPRIAIDWSSEDARWCEVVDCGDRRLTFRPKVGNAVFWKNLREDGSLHEDSLHAGLPLEHGAKIGLNIWMRNGIYPHLTTE